MLDIFKHTTQVGHVICFSYRKELALGVVTRVNRVRPRTLTVIPKRNGDFGLDFTCAYGSDKHMVTHEKDIIRKMEDILAGVQPHKSNEEERVFALEKLREVYEL